MWFFLGSNDCFLCHHIVCLFMKGSQIKLRVNLSFRYVFLSGLLSNQYRLWYCVEWAKYDQSSNMSYKISFFSCIFFFGHWQDNIMGWERKVSVQLMYSSTSTSVLPGCGLGAVVIVPVEYQVNIMIVQLCYHIIYYAIYEWLNCVISWSSYGPKHRWAINDWGIWLDGPRWYLNLTGFLQRKLCFSLFHVLCRLKHWCWICR